MAEFDPREDMVGALRFLEARHQLAVDQLAAAMVCKAAVHLLWRKLESGEIG